MHKKTPGAWLHWQGHGSDEWLKTLNICRFPEFGGEKALHIRRDFCMFIRQVRVMSSTSQGLFQRGMRQGLPAPAETIILS